MSPAPDPLGVPASLNWQPGKNFSKFRLRVSFKDAPEPSRSPYTFSVYGDERLLWKSRPLRSLGDEDACEVSVKGVAHLEIKVGSQGPRTRREPSKSNRA
jgi:hypothetical protein